MIYEFKNDDGLSEAVRLSNVLRITPVENTDGNKVGLVIFKTEDTSFPTGSIRSCEKSEELIQRWKDLEKLSSDALAEEMIVDKSRIVGLLYAYDHHDDFNSVELVNSLRRLIQE